MLSDKHMPKGAKSQNVMKIAARGIYETVTADGKSAAAVALGRKGGQARAKALSRSKRLQIAKQAALTRWRKSKA
jgi:hypothetical protein